MTTTLYRRLQVLGAPPPLSPRRDRGLEVDGARPTRGPCRVVTIRGPQRFEIALHPRINLGDQRRARRLSEVTPLRVDGSARAAIDRHQLTAASIELCAQPCQGATNSASRFEVVTPTVGERVGIGPPRFEQPQQFHVALRLRLQAPARPSAVKIAVNGPLELLARLIARAPSGRRHPMANAERFQIKCIDKRIHATHGVIGSDIILKPWWELDRFVAVRALDVAPSGPKRRHRNQRHECPIRGQIPEFLHSLALQPTAYSLVSLLGDVGESPSRVMWTR